MTSSYALRDSTTMLRRDLRHVQRYPGLSLFPIFMPVVFLLLFVYVFGGTLGNGITVGGGRGEPLIHRCKSSPACRATRWRSWDPFAVCLSMADFQPSARIPAGIRGRRPPRPSAPDARPTAHPSGKSQSPAGHHPFGLASTHAGVWRYRPAVTSSGTLHLSGRSRASMVRQLHRAAAPTQGRHSSRHG